MSTINKINSMMENYPEKEVFIRFKAIKGKPMLNLDVAEKVSYRVRRTNMSSTRCDVETYNINTNLKRNVSLSEDEIEIMGLKKLELYEEIKNEIKPKK